MSGKKTNNNDSKESLFKRTLLFAAAAGISTILLASIMSPMDVAAHPHYLKNPGTCAQLANSDDTGGPHPENNEPLDGDVLHNTVHTGTAGTTGFDQPNNPVDANKGEC